MTITYHGGFDLPLTPPAYNGEFDGEFQLVSRAPHFRVTDEMIVSFYYYYDWQSPYDFGSPYIKTERVTKTGEHEILDIKYFEETREVATWRGNFTLIPPTDGGPFMAIVDTQTQYAPSGTIPLAATYTVICQLFTVDETTGEITFGTKLSETATPAPISSFSYQATLKDAVFLTKNRLVIITWKAYTISSANVTIGRYAVSDDGLTLTHVGNTTWNMGAVAVASYANQILQISEFNNDVAFLYAHMSYSGIGASSPRREVVNTFNWNTGALGTNSTISNNGSIDGYIMVLTRKLKENVVGMVQWVRTASLVFEIRVNEFTYNGSTITPTTVYTDPSYVFTPDISFYEGTLYWHNRAQNEPEYQIDSYNKDSGLAYNVMPNSLFARGGGFVVLNEGFILLLGPDGAQFWSDAVSWVGRVGLSGENETLAGSTAEGGVADGSASIARFSGIQDISAVWNFTQKSGFTAGNRFYIHDAGTIKMIHECGFSP